MWRRESPSKAPQDHSKQPKMTGNDIIQLYNSESKAAKEKKKKLDEIQRRARKKDHTHYLSLAETQARMEKRRKQHMYKQLQAGSSRTKLPAIQISTDSRKTNSNHERSSKLLLGYLPSSKDQWPEILQKQRSIYKQFVREIIIEQCKGTKSGKESKHFDVDHPLNPNPDSHWLAFFKDNEVLLQIDKDCRRLCPDISFFQVATKYPNKEVLSGDDRDFETLRERVLRTHLEAAHVNTNRSGLKNVLYFKNLTMLALNRALV